MVSSNIPNRDNKLCIALALRVAVTVSSNIPNRAPAITVLVTASIRLRKKTVEDGGEILGQVGGYDDMLAGARMDEFQLARVQALAAKPLVGRGRAVKRIAEQRMPDVRHVDANLMRAPGLEPAADVRVAAVARNDLPVRDRAA